MPIICLLKIKSPLLFIKVDFNSNIIFKSFFHHDFHQCNVFAFRLELLIHTQKKNSVSFHLNGANNRYNIILVQYLSDDLYKRNRVVIILVRTRLMRIYSRVPIRHILISIHSSRRVLVSRTTAKDSLSVCQWLQICLYTRCHMIYVDRK